MTGATEGRRGFCLAEFIHGLHVEATCDLLLHCVSPCHVTGMPVLCAGMFCRTDGESTSSETNARGTDGLMGLRMGSHEKDTTPSALLVSREEILENPK